MGVDAGRPAHRARRGRVAPGSSARRCRARTRACCSRRSAGPRRRRSGAARCRSHTASGGGPLVVRMRVRADDRVRPIWTVTGMIRGSERPDQVVIVGNHRDAWIYGGVDPSSGTAAMMELARDARRARARRLAAEAIDPVRELGRRGVHADLVHRMGRGARRDCCRQHAVAYLNVDSAASGPALHRVGGAGAQPADRPRSPQTVKDPVARISRSPRRFATRVDRRGALPGGAGRRAGGQPPRQRIRLHRVPQFSRRAGRRLSFGGPYGVYHSIYDNHNWVARIGDPGLPLSRRAGAALGADGAAAGGRGRPAARLRGLRTPAHRGVRERGRRTAPWGSAPDRLRRRRTRARSSGCRGVQREAGGTRAVDRGHDDAGGRSTGADARRARRCSIRRASQGGRGTGTSIFRAEVHLRAGGAAGRGRGRQAGRCRSDCGRHRRGWRAPCTERPKHSGRGKIGGCDAVAVPMNRGTDPRARRAAAVLRRSRRPAASGPHVRRARRPGRRLAAALGIADPDRSQLVLDVVSVAFASPDGQEAGEPLLKSQDPGGVPLPEPAVPRHRSASARSVGVARHDPAAAGCPTTS